MTTNAPISLLPKKQLSPSPARTRAPQQRQDAIDVFLVDDHRASSYRLWASLSAQSTVRTVTTAERVEDAFALAAQPGLQLGMVAAAFGTGEGLTIAHRLASLPQELPVLVYADRMDAQLAGATVIAGANGSFDFETGPEELAETITRTIHGERTVPPLLPDPFSDLAGLVAEQDRPIVALLLLGSHPDDIASLCGISGRSFRRRHREIVRRLDTGLGRDHAPQDPPTPPSRSSLPSAPASSLSAGRQMRNRPTRIRRERAMRS